MTSLLNYQTPRKHGCEGLVLLQALNFNSAKSESGPAGHWAAWVRLIGVTPPQRCSIEPQDKQESKALSYEIWSWRQIIGIRSEYKLTTTISLSYAGEHGHRETCDHLGHFARLAQLHRAH
jgi:hypothetical protein